MFDQFFQLVYFVQPLGNHITKKVKRFLNMDSGFNLPTKEEFKKGGQFYKLKVERKSIFPTELMKFIFPDYLDMLFKQKPKPSKKTMEVIKDYCISTKKQALKEERLLKQKQQKDIETRQLEEKIKDYFDNYYKNLYKHCTCNKR